MRTRQHSILTLLTAFGLFVCQFQAQAEQAYITDKVVIEIHSLIGEQGLVITSLSSGTPVEVISTEGEYTQIQTEDNKKGWLHSNYLSFEKPASLEYLQLLGKYKNLTKDLQDAQAKLSRNQELEKTAKAAEFSRDELNKSKKQIQGLDKQLKDTSHQLDEANQKIASLEKSLATQASSSKLPESAAKIALEKKSTVEIQPLQVDQGPFKVPFIWSAVAMIFTFIIGIVTGMKWLDHRIRKRHGGVRFY